MHVDTEVHQYNGGTQALLSTRPSTMRAWKVPLSPAAVTATCTWMFWFLPRLTSPHHYCTHHRNHGRAPSCL